uniref:p505_4R n=1 Tax=African swine fever virus TaxID=10497 RepID=A0A6G7KU19_ASF
MLNKCFLFKTSVGNIFFKFLSLLLYIYYKRYDYTGKNTDLFNEYERTLCLYSEISPFLPMWPCESQPQRETKGYYIFSYHGKEIFIMCSYELYRVSVTTCFICMVLKLQTTTCFYHPSKTQIPLQNVMCYPIVLCGVLYTMLYNILCFLFSKNTEIFCQKSWRIRNFLRRHVWNRNMLYFYGWDKLYYYMRRNLFLLLPSKWYIFLCYLYAIPFFLLLRWTFKMFLLHYYQNTSKYRLLWDSCTLCYKLYNMVEMYISRFYLQLSRMFIQKFYTILFGGNNIYHVQILQTYYYPPYPIVHPKKLYTYSCLIYTIPYKISLQKYYNMSYKVVFIPSYYFYKKRKYTYWNLFCQVLYIITMAIVLYKILSVCLPFVRKKCLQWLREKVYYICLSNSLSKNMFIQMFLELYLYFSKTYYVPCNIQKEKRHYLFLFIQYIKLFIWRLQKNLYYYDFMSCMLQLFNFYLCAKTVLFYPVLYHLFYNVWILLLQKITLLCYKIYKFCRNMC